MVFTAGVRAASAMFSAPGFSAAPGFKRGPGGRSDKDSKVRDSDSFRQRPYDGWVAACRSLRHDAPTASITAGSIVLKASASSADSRSCVAYRRNPDLRTRWLHEMAQGRRFRPPARPGRRAVVADRHLEVAVARQHDDLARSVEDDVRLADGRADCGVWGAGYNGAGSSSARGHREVALLFQPNATC